MEKIKLDEYYSNGFMELVRVGKDIHLRNNMTDVQQKQYIEYFKNNYDEKYTEIHNQIDSIKHKILKCDPIQILTFSADMGLLSLLNKYSEFDINSEAEHITRATEFIQSIIVSSPFGYLENIEEDKSSFFHEILKDIEDLYTLVEKFYPYLGEKLEDFIPNIDGNTKNYLIEAQMMYLVRGQRYQIFEEEYYGNLLEPHSMIFEKLFKISSKDIVSGIKKLQYSLTQEKIDAMKHICLEFDAWSEYEHNYEDLPYEKKSIGLDFYNKCFGTDLRNVTKVTNWPDDFVDELSWGIDNNEKTNFFNNSDFSGWPINYLPIFKRPFIKIKEEYYCFDYYSLMDNFYRTLQKTVSRLCQEYHWKDMQQLASENMVKNIFKDILPNCTIYTSNYYPLNNSMKQPSENDLIVQYDDTLIIVEVKAGSFVYTPPISDFDAHIKSYKNLIEKADHQCQRTKEYLQKNEIAIIYDNNKQVKAKINMTEIKNIYMMAVTVDNINAVASKAEKMRFLDLKSNALCIAVDDLMVYREYFNSPLLFLHFLQQRTLATQEPKLALNDELDHLGMYIEHNCYPLYVSGFPKNDRLNFVGYRNRLDEYLCKKFHPQLKPKKPIQKLPHLFLEIINYLEKNEIRNRSFIANYFLSFSSEYKSEFCDQFLYVTRRQKETKKIIPFHASGTGDSLKYSCFIDQLEIDSPSFCWKRKYTLACLHWSGDDNRFMIDIKINQNNKIEKIELLHFTPQDIKDEEKEMIKSLGVKIASNRMINYKTQNKNKGKIGRNQLCPCGSGKKYKKCCIK